MFFHVIPGAYAHSHQLREDLFFLLPARSILSYIQSGTGYNITSVLVRSHGHPQPGSHPPRVDIWFTGGGEVDWFFLETVSGQLLASLQFSQLDADPSPVAIA
jgi:hypothetical protein